MRLPFILFVLIPLAGISQNNLHLFSGSGKPFRVLHNDKYISAPQTDIVLSGIKKDTFQLKLEFDGRKYGATFYLLNKGLPVDHREFSYRVEPLKDKLNIVYMGMDTVLTVSRKLVPDKPAVETKQ
jgi:hypothetical protein